MIKDFVNKIKGKILLACLLTLSLFSTTAEAKKRIAILPFEVLSEKSEHKQFGIGTMDTLSVAMTSISDFVMIDRGRISKVIQEQSFQKSGFTDVNQSTSLGKIMGAEIIVTGSIQSFDNEFRITANFIEVETGKILKASKVTGNNIFQLQDKMADQLLQLENITLNETQRSEISKITNSTNNAKAFDYYTTGRTYYYKLLDYGLSSKGINETKEDYLNNHKMAMENFDKAISLDDKYFLAIASKSETQSLHYAFLASSGEGNKEEIYKYLSEAKKNAELAFSLSKNSGVIYRAFALHSFMSMNINKTIEYSKKAIEYNPNDEESYLWLSMSYYMEGYNFFEQNQLDNAIVSLNNCIKANPIFTNAYYKLGNIYEIKNDSELAIIYYKKALKIYPKNEEVKKDLISLYHKVAIDFYKKSNFVKVEETYKSIIEINPNDSDAYNNLASKYLMDKKFELAEEMYKKAINSDPKRSIFYQNLGLLYDTIKNTKEAQIYYKKACDLGNSDSCNLLNK